MSKKTIVKRRRFNFLRFIVFVFILFIIVLLFTNLLKEPIKNIIISGNNILSDETIIETSSLENYPSFIKTTSHKICKKIMKLDFVKSCEVKKKWGYIVEINLEEYKILYKKRSTNEYVLESGKILNQDKVFNGVPLLINYITDELEEKLISELSQVDKNIIGKISEIEYSPTTYDTQRFILYMNDGNMVYITLTKTLNLNKYNEIKKELEGKSGILYLDSGNYFEIKE